MGGENDKRGGRSASLNDPANAPKHLGRPR
jgi:hypothetical protein